MVVVAADGDSSDDQNCPRTPAAADYSDEKAEGVVVVVVGENKVADRNFPEEGIAVVAPTLEGEGEGGEGGCWWMHQEGRLVAEGAQQQEEESLGAPSTEVVEGCGEVEEVLLHLIQVRPQKEAAAAEVKRQQGLQPLLLVVPLPQLSHLASPGRPQRQTATARRSLRWRR